MQSFSLREKKGRRATGFDGPREIKATMSSIAREEVWLLRVVWFCNMQKVSLDLYYLSKLISTWFLYV